MSVLQIEGEVARPRAFQFEDLRNLPGQVEDVSELVPGRQGSAVSLDAVLKAAGVSAEATHIGLESTDGGFAASVELGDVAGAIISYRLGEQPLPVSQGGPIRFFIPEASHCRTGPIDACANVKFLGKIRLSIGQGKDTRPTNEAEHAALHEAEHAALHEHGHKHDHDHES